MRQQSSVLRARVGLVAWVVVVAGALCFAGAARAATTTVTTEAQFEDAVQAANTAGGSNTIDVVAGQYSPNHTIVLTNGTLTIQGPTTPDATTSATPALFLGSAVTFPEPAASVFSVNAGVTVNFDNIELEVAGSSGNPAIDDFGTVNLNQSTVTPEGPGITVEQTGTATLVNSTISDGLDFGIIDQGTATLTNTTVTRNVGGIAQTGTLTLTNSIVAENTSPSPDCTAAATHVDHSLDSDGTCGVGTLSNKDPKLGFLGILGGTTGTSIPDSGSPAIGAGDPGVCPSVDQRGAPSPSVSGHACDIGSVETYYGVAPVLTTANVQVASANASGTVATFAVTWRAGAPVTPASPACTAVLGNVGGGPTVTVTSGTTVFPPGTTTVTCSGTDSVFGASGSGTFTVTDVRATPPVITPPGNITTPATSSAGAAVTYSGPTVTDSTDGTSDVATCTAPVGPGQSIAPAPSGTMFPVGTTTVTCNAMDSQGLSAVPVTFTITVQPFVVPVGPTLSATANIMIDATSASGAVVTYTLPTATDPAGGTDPVTCIPASGSTFSIGGPTPVNCTATARDGVAGSSSFTVTVDPGSPPVVTVPADISVPATAPGGAQVTYTASANDPKDGVIPVTCVPASGSTFAIGPTTVTCTATDSLGNASTGHFTVTVTQATPPTIVVPANITLAAAIAGGAKVSFTATATDPVDGALTPSCTPASGTTFPVGTTTVTCTATDRAQLSTSATFTVTVTAAGAPVITVPAFRELGALTSAGDPVTYVVTATDQIDGALTPTCTPPSGATFPIGTTTVTCTATDSGGRTSTATFDVQVDPPQAATAPSNVFTTSSATSKGKLIDLGLKFPGAGKVVVVATFKHKVKGKNKTVRFGGVSERVPAGSKKITLTADKAGVVQLDGMAKTKKLSVTVTVTFTPTGGTAHAKHSTVKIKGLKAS